jgi:hypothetical protein
MRQSKQFWWTLGVLVPLLALAQISGPQNYSSVINLFLRSTTAAAARSAIDAAQGTNSVLQGTIGINTTGPAKALEVNSATGANLRLTYNDSDGSAANYADFSVTSSGSLTIAPTQNLILRGSAGNTLQLGTGSTTYFTLSSIAGTFSTAVNVGAGTTAPDKKLEINSATGSNLRLTYNDSDGSAANYADFSTSSSGDLIIAPSGLDASVTGRFASTATSVTLAAAATALAITSNVVTVTGDAGANTVATITGGLSGQVLTLIFADSLVTVTDDATGNANTVNLSAAFTSTANDTLMLVFNGTSWREVARSVN